MGPSMLSWHAAAPGNTAARRSAVRMRMSGAGTLPRPVWRNTASERVAFQRQRVSKSGACRTAWTRMSRRPFCGTKPGTRSRGKLCWAPSEMTMPSSVAAAWSSKLNERQKALRSARPQARLMRAPKGAWMTSCMPPPSSKNRSATTVSCVGSVPSAARAAAR